MGVMLRRPHTFFFYHIVYLCVASLPVSLKNQAWLLCQSVPKKRGVATVSVRCNEGSVASHSIKLALILIKLKYCIITVLQNITTLCHIVVCFKCIFLTFTALFW